MLQKGSGNAGEPRVICQSGIGEEEEEEKVLKSRGMCAEGRPL